MGERRSSEATCGGVPQHHALAVGTSQRKRSAIRTEHAPWICAAALRIEYQRVQPLAVQRIPERKGSVLLHRTYYATVGTEGIEFRANLRLMKPLKRRHVPLDDSVLVRQDESLVFEIEGKPTF